jgi:K+-sensing histidine kinase KdpD
MTRPGLLRRYPPRDLWALAAGLAGPLAASGGLLLFRASWSNTNAALLPVVVVVAVAAAGNRLAGALAAVGAAVWFDIFFTLPYYRLTIRSSDDITTAVLLLVTGLAVSQRAAWARKLKVIAVTGEGYLETMHGTAALARASWPGVAAILPACRDALACALPATSRVLPGRGRG